MPAPRSEVLSMYRRTLYALYVLFHYVQIAAKFSNKQAWILVAVIFLAPILIALFVFGAGALFIGSMIRV